MRKLVYILIAITLLSSCSKDSFNNLFEKTADERVEASIKEWKQILCSSDLGWEGVYYLEGPYSLGFYTIMKFQEDGKVGIILTKGEKYEMSEYRIESGANIELRLVTWNKSLTWLANPGGVSPSGYGVELEYTLVSHTENEIVFEGKVNKGKLVLNRCDEYFENKMDIITENENLFFDNMKFVNNSICVTKGITGASEDDPFVISLIPDKNLFFWNLKYFDVDGAINEVNNVIQIFTPYGMSLSIPVQIGDKKIQNFKFNQEKNAYVIVDEGFEGYIISTKLPILATPGVTDVLINSIAKMRFSDYGDDLCPKLKTLIEEITDEDYKVPASFGGAYLVTNFTEQIPVLDEYGRRKKDENYNYIYTNGKKLGNGLLFSKGYKSYFDYVFIPLKFIKLSEDRVKIERNGEVISNVEGGIEWGNNKLEVQEFISILTQKDGYLMSVYKPSYGIQFDFTSINDPDNITFKISEFNFN